MLPCTQPLVYQAIARLHSDLDDARNRVSLRDRDFDSLQEGVRQQGESHTNDRFALELEVERVKRDLQRAEEDLEQLRRDLSKKDYALGEREDAIAELVSLSTCHPWLETAAHYL